MKIKCVIADDEQLARQLLKSYIDQLPQMELVTMCKNAVEVLSVLQESKVDLLLLDIQMPDLTGIDLLKTIQHPPMVIFTTAYKEYALEGYELNVADYMLKPIAFDRFVRGVNKVQELINLKNTEPGNGAAPARDEAKSYISIKADHKIYKVNFSDILYIEGMREYVAFHTNNQKILTLESLKKLEETLPSDLFIRVHKSFIINKSKILSLSGNQIEMKEVNIPIGKSYKKEVLSLFD